jgi:PAS domain S-box-containing protein
MMILKKHLRSGVILFLLLMLLGFVFVQSRNLDADKHEQILTHLSEVNQLDGRLTDLLLKVRYHLLNNYDPVNQSFNEIEKHLNDISQTLALMSRDGSEQLLESIQQERQKLEQKEEIWLDIASHNAVLKNSLHYADKLILQAKMQQHDNAIIQWQLYDQLERQLITLNGLGMVQLQSPQRVDQLLAQLQKNALIDIDALTTHVNLVQQSENKVNQLLQIFRSDRLNLGTQLLQNYRQFVDQHSRRADTYLWLLFTLAGLLVVYAGYSFRQEQRMLRLLKSQQFALDEHAIVSITDKTGIITYANSRFCRVSGYTLDELIGNTHRLVNSGYHPHAFFTQLWRTITDGNVWHGQVCNRSKTGDIYWVNATVVPVTDTQGKIEQYISIRTDITNQKLLEASLSAAKEAAEAGSRAKSDFLATMSHEIRTPMNGILGMTEIVLDTNLDDEQREYIQIVKDSSESLMVVINDILDFSKIEAGKLQLESSAFVLRKTATDAIRTLEARAKQKGLVLSAHLADDLPDVLLGDAARLRQILLNFLGNAVKFTEQGSVQLAVSKVAQDERRIQLLFKISDTGIGIPNDKLDHIFEAFSQADNSVTRQYGGTGLGLAICRKLVEMMDGEIHVESKLNEGSCFSFNAWFNNTSLSA